MQWMMQLLLNHQWAGSLAWPWWRWLPIVIWVLLVHASPRALEAARSRRRYRQSSQLAAGKAGGVAGVVLSAISAIVCWSVSFSCTKLPDASTSAHRFNANTNV
jgi:hypothetical protein